MAKSAHDTTSEQTLPDKVVAAAMYGALALGVALAAVVFGLLRAGVPVGDLPGRLGDIGVALGGWDGEHPDRAGTYAPLVVTGDGKVATWPACTPIRWVANIAAAEPGALEDLRRAIDEVSDASGIPFVEIGTTDHVPTVGAHQVPGADLVVAWVTPEQSDFLDATYAAHPWAVGTPYLLGENITSAVITLDATHQGEYPGGFGTGATRGKLLLHELGHVLGLGHVDDDTQVMNEELSRRFPSRLGSGDRAGLAAYGCTGT